MALVELARFQTKVEADLVRLLLEAEGFDVVLFDEAMGYLGLGSILPVRLMVHDSDYMAAAELLIEEGLR